MYMAQVTWCKTISYWTWTNNENTAKPKTGIFHLRSNQSKLVLLETILKCYQLELDASRLSPSQDQSQIAQVVIIPANHARLLNPTSPVTHIDCTIHIIT